MSVDAGSALLVALSAGPDSTALLWGLQQLGHRRGLRIEAAHVDHALDPGSSERAERARRTCGRLGVPLTVVRRPVSRSASGARGVEAAARRVRYDALEEIRRSRRAAYVVTAHHRDDQIETVLLRLLHGSGWRGLAGIPSRNQAVVRPLLDLSRHQLRAVLAASGLVPATDPSNLDLDFERNRLRHRLLPHLTHETPELGSICVGIGAAANGARRKVDARLQSLFDLRTSDGEASLVLAELARLPAALLPAAAALLHRAAGAEYPPASAAVAELARQLSRGDRIGCDAGDGWRWQEGRERLRLVRAGAKVGDFTYTLVVPGQVELAEISLRLRIDHAPVADWMFRGSPTKAGLRAAFRDGDTVTVRNRRPGDRLRPLGCTYSRRLKEILIDRHVPRAERDRIPLLCVGGRIAWVPGVTIDESFRLGDDRRAWVAELEPA